MIFKSKGNLRVLWGFCMAGLRSAPLAQEQER